MGHKSKILHLYKLLNEKTDEENPISTTQIIKELAKLGITLNRKTVASDIALLGDFGIDVITLRSSQNMYYIGGRDFELPEVKLLVDAVESSKLITHKKSKKLVEKLSKLVSENQSSEINSNIFIDKRIKPVNEEIYYSIDSIQKAIANNKKIEFKYKNYNPDKSIVYRHTGMIYTLSPYALAWSDDHYYVRGSCDNYSEPRTFRVDRMAQVSVTEIGAEPTPKDFNPAEYVKTVFDMYSGELQQVELECANYLMNVIIDKFGEHVQTEIIDDNHFKVIVEVCVSPTFFGWVFQFAGKMKILEPCEVKKQFADMLNNSLEII